MKFSLLLTAMLAAPMAHAHGDKALAMTGSAEQTDWGIADKPAQATRTMTIAMTDAMRFSPDSIAVSRPA